MSATRAMLARDLIMARQRLDWRIITIDRCDRRRYRQGTARTTTSAAGALEARDKVLRHQRLEGGSRFDHGVMVLTGGDA